MIVRSNMLTSAIAYNVMYSVNDNTEIHHFETQYPPALNIRLFNSVRDIEHNVSSSGCNTEFCAFFKDRNADLSAHRVRLN
jgi:hypothetical protein